MSKIISLTKTFGASINYEEIKIVPQQINRSQQILFLDNVKLSDFPTDYIEYIEYFGEGLLGGYLRIFPIHFIDQLIVPWHNRTSKNIFFKSNSVISHQQLSKSLIIGDTLDNAQFIYFEGNYFIYNVEIEEFVVKVGKRLQDIFEWFITGRFYDPIMLDTFMPFDSNKTVSPLSRIIGSFFYDIENNYNNKQKPVDNNI